MPTKVEKDAITGQETTGHEWDGIKELNTPLPRWWLWVLYATILWAVVWWILYPSWPFLRSYAPGVLGSNQRLDVAAAIAEAERLRGPVLGRIAELPLEDVLADSELLGFSLAAARPVFAENCVPCHGPGGAGQIGFPALADDAWIWGGSIEDIHETIRVGIRSDHLETRMGEMPSFGTLGILSRQEIMEVAEHVLALSGQDHDATLAAAGSATFLEQCAACHGETGGGEPLLGAPALDDPIWVFGGTRQAIVAQITRSQHGVMPPWEGRLDATMIKMLAVYVHALGGGR
jgi:cytochrome c oxidase cbb3-type subunit III